MGDQLIKDDSDQPSFGTAAPLPETLKPYRGPPMTLGNAAAAHCRPADRLVQGLPPPDRARTQQRWRLAMAPGSRGATPNWRLDDMIKARYTMYPLREEGSLGQGLAPRPMQQAPYDFRRTLTVICHRQSLMHQGPKDRLS
jgi:hypothetical protein